MIHVGMESALTGSACVMKGIDATVSADKSPSPNKKGEWASNPRVGPRAHAAANPAALANAMFRPRGRVGCSGLVEASLNPHTCEYSRANMAKELHQRQFKAMVRCHASTIEHLCLKTTTMNFHLVFFSFFVKKKQRYVQ